MFFIVNKILGNIFASVHILQLKRAKYLDVGNTASSLIADFSYSYRKSIFSIRFFRPFGMRREERKKLRRTEIQDNWEERVWKIIELDKLCGLH